MSDYALVISTVPNQRLGEKIADLLLERKLAACISIMPEMESHYYWEGKKEKSRELLLLVKAMKKKYTEIEALIVENHPYDCPEVLQVSIENGFSPYLKWIGE